MRVRRAFFTLCVLCSLAVISPIVVAGANRSSTPTAKLSPSPPTGAPGDWQMYGHDPQRTNYNTAETTIGVDNVNQLVEAWQAEIGIGSSAFPASSGPIVAGGRVYVASSVAEGDNFFAQDATTGSRDWSAFIGYNPNECFGLGIGSTPAISGTTIAIGGGDSAYYGIDATNGAQLWRDPMDAGPSAFAWASPLIANGRAYVGVASDCDNPSVRGELRALDLSNGTHLANQYFVPGNEAGAGIWNSPALSSDGSRVIAATGEDYGGYDGPYNRALIVLDADTLDILASDKQGSVELDQDWATTPVVFHDSSGRELVGAAHKDGDFYAYELDSVGNGPIWARNIGIDTGMMPAYDPTFGDGGTLFFAGDGDLYAVDPDTGQDRWLSIPTIGEMHGNMAVANGLIYINSDGSLLIIEETTGILLRTIRPANALHGFSGPVVSNGTVYWVTGAYLNAWHIGVEPSPTTTATTTATVTATVTTTATRTPCPTCPTPTASPTSTCSIQFSDVPPDSAFYPYIHCLACLGIVSGYDDGAFEPDSSITRGQTAKIVSNSADYTGDPGVQLYQDVPEGSPFFFYVQQLGRRSLVNGYPCGDAGEPCAPANLPYFRPGAGATRGQIAKLVSETAGLSGPIGAQLFEDAPPGSTFYTYTQRLANQGIISGYPCDNADPSKPCVPPLNRPYFLTGNGATRGEASKITSGAFFPECSVGR